VISLEFVISKFVFVTLIVIPMALVMTALNTGFTPALWRRYPKNAAIAFLVAFPCSIVLTPIAAVITRFVMDVLT
jgi:hypothetical protein